MSTALTPTNIVTRGGRVYFRKRCPTHGEREDFVCSDVKLVRPPGIHAPCQAAQRIWRGTRQGLPLRLRPLHGARATNLRGAGRDHLELQSHLPHVLCGECAGRKAPFGGRMSAGERHLTTIHQFHRGRFDENGAGFRDISLVGSWALDPAPAIKSIPNPTWRRHDLMAFARGREVKPSTTGRLCNGNESARFLLPTTFRWFPLV
jgi:hypothetical protein